MDEQILRAIEDYRTENPGFELNNRVLDDIREYYRTFEKIIAEHGWQMQLSFEDEGALTIEFASEEGNVYTTYKFYKTVIPKR